MEYKPPLGLDASMTGLSHSCCALGEGVVGVDTGEGKGVVGNRKLGEGVETGDCDSDASGTSTWGGMVAEGEIEGMGCTRTGLRFFMR
eukprot:scaffold42600_cov191-Amphora_coffeaeformis.AAC.2